MKKSEKYYMAMLAVINSNNIFADAKIEIIETLLDNKSTAEWVEEQEEKKQDEKKREGMKNGESV